jgi:hypothetical protein
LQEQWRHGFPLVAVAEGKDRHNADHPVHPQRTDRATVGVQSNRIRQP